MLYHASDGVHIVDEHAKLLQASRKFCTMLGYDCAEMLGMHVSQWDINSNPQQIDARLRQNLQHTEGLSFETQHRHKDGHLIDVEISVLPFVFQGKSLLYCSSRDISEQKKLKRYLQQQVRFNTLLSDANEIIAATAVEQDLLQKLCALIISSIQAVLVWVGKPESDGYFQFVTTSGAVEHLLQLRASVHADSIDGQGLTGETWRRAQPMYETDLLQSDFHQERLALAHQAGLAARASLPIKRQGQLWGILAIYFAQPTDFTPELKKILEDLATDIGFGLDRLDIIQSERDSNTYNLLLLNNLSSGIIVMSYPERIIEQTNQRAMDFFGIHAQTGLLSQNTRKLFADEADYLRMGEFSEQVLANGQGTVRNVRYLRQDDGSIVYADLSGQRMPSRDKAQRIIWTIVDTTERHQKEAALQQLSQEYQNQLDNAVTGIALVRKHRIISCNIRLVKMTGLSMEQLVGAPTRTIYFDATDYARTSAAYADLQRRGFAYIKNVSIRHIKDGARLCDLHGRILKDGITSVWTIEDVSRREADARRLRRLSHFNALLSEANQIIAKIDNEAILLEQICALPLQFTDAKLCWIGKPDEAGWFRFLTSAGANNYLNHVRFSSLPDLPEGKGITGEAWRQNRVLFTANMGQPHEMQPWHAIAKQFKLASSANLPIWRTGKLWALLTVYYGQEDIFDNSLQKILEDLAEDIGFGLDRIDIMAQQRKSNALNVALLSNTSAGIHLVRYPERIIIDANQAFMNLLGYQQPEEFLQQPIKYLPSSQNRHMTKLTENILNHKRGSLRDVEMLRADGSRVFIDISGQRLPQGQNDQPVIVWTLVDVTERYRLSMELSRQALFDVLTNLPNRRALDHELGKAMARADRHDRILATCMIDLDGFKPVNDTWGHDVGDQVLKIIAQRLRDNLRRTDFVARLGGDEFVLLLEDCRSMDEITVALNKIGDAIHQPIVLSHKISVQIGLSAGISLYPFLDNHNPDMLIRYADQALYISKAMKGERSHYWNLYGDRQAGQINPAPSLLEQGKLELFYQPILDNRSRKIVGIEALARIRNAHGLLLAPAEFLPLLCNDDLFELSRRVLRQAIQDVTHLDDRGLQLWVSINIDPTSISARCVHCLKNLIQEHTISPERIVLEILEGSNFLEQKDAINHLLELKALGVRLALDDVGSAYSSLLRLKSLPIDEVKLDQGFVRTLEQDPTGILFTATILDLARDLGVGMVVEGVETDDILDVVSVLGIPLLQGYQIARPMPFAELCIFLDHPPQRQRQHPTSLLGVYAKQIAYDRSFRNAMRQHNNIINPMQLRNTTSCPIHDDLMRLGYSAQHPLHQQHQHYHTAIATCNQTLSIGSTHEDWRAIQSAQDTFLLTLLHHYQTGKTCHATHHSG